MISQDLAGRSADGFVAVPATGAAAAVGKTGAGRRLLVWDLPLRVFHWSLVVAVAASVVTGKIGGNAMELHGKAGLAIVGLVVFRLAWGVLGSSHARFGNFFPTPGAVRAYLKGQWRGVGHNPLGAASVIALIAVLATQAATGLFSSDDIAYAGPLNPAVSEALATRLSAVHRVMVNVLLGLVALHVLAVAYHSLIKRNDLVKPMITGWKAVPHGESTHGGGRIALAVSVVIAALVVVLAGGAAGAAAPAKRPAAAGTAATPAW